MFNSWKLGRVAGIDLYLHPTFLLLLAVVYLFNGGWLAAAFTVAVFGCVLLHEYGHALTARSYGIRTHDITLYPIGGVARLERLPRKPGAELLVTLAGPAVNVAIAALLGGILALGQAIHPGGSLTPVGLFLHTLMVVNLMLAAFNLLPAFPMDGGRVLRALLSGWLGRLRATEVAVSVGQLTAIALPLVLLYLGAFSVLHILLAAFVFFAAANELKQVQAEEAARRPIVVPAGPEPGVWIAPAGYSWVRRGRDAWQLIPVVVTAANREPFTRRRGQEPAPWRID